MLDLSCFAELVEQFLLDSGFLLKDIVYLKTLPFESLDQLEKILKEMKKNAEKK